MKLNSFMLICLFSFYISFHLFERKLKVIRFDCPLKYNCQLYSVSVYYLQSLSHSFHFLALTPLVFIVLFFQSEMYMRLALRWLVAYIFIILSGNESVWPSLCHVLQNIFFFVLFFLTYSMVTRTATKKTRRQRMVSQAAFVLRFLLTVHLIFLLLASNWCYLTFIQWWRKTCNFFFLHLYRWYTAVRLTTSLVLMIA